MIESPDALAGGERHEVASRICTQGPRAICEHLGSIEGVWNKSQDRLQMDTAIQGVRSRGPRRSLEEAAQLTAPGVWRRGPEDSRAEDTVPAVGFEEAPRGT